MRTPASTWSRAASSRCARGRRCESWPAPAARRRSAGLEAPFVGRERELTGVIESFEESASQRHARLVTVTGDAGVGKSRLLWEFFKYTDGVEKLVRWHQGRCLAYGEGVAYWALAEMVRSRAGIVEEEEPGIGAREAARARSRSTCPMNASGGWSSRGSRICWGSSSGPPRTARTCSQAGGCSSNGSPPTSRS